MLTYVNLIMEEIKMKNATIYTTKTCIWCKKAKEFFKENNIRFTEKDVGSDMMAANEMIEKSGQMSVPVIDINGKIIIGFDKLKELSRIPSE